jgi:hypothetical protein
VTDEGRRRQIETALAARLERPEGDRASNTLFWRKNPEKTFPVVDLPIEVPLLWADSHRIRAELEDPSFEFIRKERTSAAAQAALHDIWRRSHRKFDRLKESLEVEGQTEPGVITREGVLINGNTRLVALRDLGKQWIRVAVLDSDAHPFELAELELRLQVRETGHDTYRLSNELLFIHEMRWQFKRSDEEIARQLNWTPSKPALGKKKVELYLRLLELARTLQMRDRHLPITFFDDESGGTGKLQQLKELDRRYVELVDAGRIAEANVLLDSWILLARTGFASVHQIRAVIQRDDFLEEYLLPRIGEQDVFAEVVDELHGSTTAASDLPGLDDLGVDDGAAAGAEGIDLQPLIRLLETPDGEGAAGEAPKLSPEATKEALRESIEGALRELRADDRADDALDAPVDALRKAAREIKRASDRFAEVRDTKEFERQIRGAFEYQVRQVRKQLKTLEERLEGRARSGRR